MYKYVHVFFVGGIFILFYFILFYFFSFCGDTLGPPSVVWYCFYFSFFFFLFILHYIIVNYFFLFLSFFIILFQGLLVHILVAPRGRRHSCL